MVATCWSAKHRKQKGGRTSGEQSVGSLAHLLLLRGHKDAANPGTALRSLIMQIHGQPPATHPPAQWAYHGGGLEDLQVNWDTAQEVGLLPVLVPTTRGLRLPCPHVPPCPTTISAKTVSARLEGNINCSFVSQVETMGDDARPVRIPYQGTVLDAANPGPRGTLARRLQRHGALNQLTSNSTRKLYKFPRRAVQIQALQFEWAWQHPQKSVIVRPIVAALGAKKLLGVRGKVGTRQEGWQQGPGARAERPRCGPRSK